MSLPEPITRKEQYYDGIAKGNANKLPEPITREEQYLEYIAKNGGGGGGGTTDYEALDNKPSVNSVELSGNKTLDDLGIQGKLTFDNEPTEDSQNPVKSGGVYEVLESLVDAISEKPDEYADLDDKPSINSVELSGNKTASELGLQEELDGAKTVSGNPITVADAEPMNAESVVVELEPKQDLHGYDAPWVGGASKNLLPMTVDGIKAYNTSGTWSGNTYSINNGSLTIQSDSAGNVTGITANGTFNAQVSFEIYRAGNPSAPYVENIYKGMILNGTALGGSDTSYCLIVLYSNDGINWANEAYGDTVISSDYDYLYFAILIRSGVTISNAPFYPMLRLSTETDPTFAPYSNICPITGYSEVNVERVGKNLLPIINTTRNVSGVDYTVNPNGTITTDGTATALSYFVLTNNTNDLNTLSNIVIPKGTTIIASSGVSNDTLHARYTNATYFDLPNDIPFTLEEDVAFVYIAVSSGVTIDEVVYSPMIRLSTETDAEFEPYQGNTYTIDLDGTKYGGTLDVTEGGYSDEWGFATLDGTETWVLQNNSRVSTIVSDNMTNSSTSGNLICSAFKTRTPDDTWFGIYGISCQDDGTVSIGGITDVSEFTTWLSNNPIQIAYRKKTPSSVSTTPTDIPLLENTNNISTDGTNITLKYQPNNVIGECKQYTDEKVEQIATLKNATLLDTVTTFDATTDHTYDLSKYRKILFVVLGNYSDASNKFHVLASYDKIELDLVRADTSNKSDNIAPSVVIQANVNTLGGAYAFLEMYLMNSADTFRYTKSADVWDIAQVKVYGLI